MIRVKKNPVYGENLFNPEGKVDCKLIIGSLFFGLGWGIGGLCPGPAIVLFAVWTIPIHLIWLGTLLLGMLLAYYVDKCTTPNPEAE